MTDRIKADVETLLYELWEANPYGAYYPVTRGMILDWHDRIRIISNRWEDAVTAKNTRPWPLIDQIPPEWVPILQDGATVTLSITDDILSVAIT